MKQIIYTDLDGTLLDFDTYSYQESEGMVKALQAKGIPLVFCSSKTRAEQEVYYLALSLSHPIIVENGSAVLIPNGYFDFDITEIIAQESCHLRPTGSWQAIVLGVDADEIKTAISQMRTTAGLEVSGYADLNLADIMRLTSLDEPAARRAADRDFSETLLVGKKEGPAWNRFLALLNAGGFQCVSGGKFHTVVGQSSNKGRAVNILNRLYQYKYDKICTIGLGDSANDLPMLEAVDRPYLVQKHNGSWLHTNSPRIQKIPAIGPKGWNIVIADLLDDAKN